MSNRIENLLLGTLIAACIGVIGIGGYTIHRDIVELNREIAVQQAEEQARERREEARRRKEEAKKAKMKAAIAIRDAAIVQPEDMIAVKDFPTPTHKEYLKAKKLVESVRDKDYKKVIAVLKTPLEAAVYCTELLEYKHDEETFGKKDHHASFKYVNENKEDDCDAGGVSPAAILSDDGFPPYVAILYTPDILSAHEVFIYKTENGRYSSIGIHNSDCVFNYPSVEKLKTKICEGLIRQHEKIVIYDLGKRFPDFIDNDIDNDPQNLDDLLK